MKCYFGNVSTKDNPDIYINYNTKAIYLTDFEIVKLNYILESTFDSIKTVFENDDDAITEIIEY